jgi:uncharacterized protein (DUF736 family)
MAIIGHFTKQENGGYTGSILTLTTSIRATFDPIAKRSDKSPAFRIMSGLAELGAAWERTSEGSNYLSVDLDDPSFAAPVKCRLKNTGAEHVYSLIWERDRKRS